MGMMLNRRRVCGGKSLPYDAEIEYLEGTGTQFIDTLLTYFADLEITAKLRTNNTNKLLGTDRTHCIERINAQQPYWYFSDGNNKYSSNILITEKHTLKWLNNNIYCDNVLLSSFSKENRYYTKMTLFGVENLIYANIIYSCKLYNPSNGVLVRDFIPVRVGNVGYMYDKVSGQLFGNAGTGDFILGPDK